MLKFENIPHDDKATYQLLGMGLTKGVFQLEEHLGERYSAVVKPRSINDIADIVSIIRPGCKEAKHVDGETSMLDAYCRIRNKQMEEAYLHPDLRPILGKTHSVLIYQEQIIEICQLIAGMSMKEADMVRYAMGKKKEHLMEEWHSVFVDGCVKNGYTEELAEQLWDWCNKASGYLFNKSHAIAYATIAYKTAYAKANYPTEFYTAMLKYADKKSDTFEEMLDLINDAKLFGIRVIPPRIKQANADFEILNNRTISYGIKYLKGVGASAIESIQRARGCKTWDEFLIASDRYKIDKTSCEALIKSGALDEFDIPRTQMLAEYDLFKKLTSTEQAIVLSLMGGILHPSILMAIDGTDFEQKRSVTKYTKLHRTGIFDICGRYGPIEKLDLPNNEINYKDQDISLSDAINILLKEQIPNSARRKKLLDIVVDYEDSQPYHHSEKLYQLWEKFYFGIELTQKGESISDDQGVISAIEVINLPPNADVKVAGIIERKTVTKIKRGQAIGQKMAFFDLSDNTYMLKSLIAFSDAYAKYKDLIKEGAPVLVVGKKMREGNSVIVNFLKKL